ncbi:hypothetical protein ACOMHN_028418 [Nucella lapillus]
MPHKSKTVELGQTYTHAPQVKDSGAGTELQVKDSGAVTELHTCPTSQRQWSCDRATSQRQWSWDRATSLRQWSWDRATHMPHKSKTVELGQTYTHAPQVKDSGAVTELQVKDSGAGTELQVKDSGAGTELHTCPTSQRQWSWDRPTHMPHKSKTVKL